MKKTLILLIAIVFLSFGISFSADGSKIVLAISGMSCPSCKITVKKSLERVKGVKSVEVSYKNKEATIIFNERITNSNELIAATGNAGFPSKIKDNR